MTVFFAVVAAIAAAVAVWLFVSLRKSRAEHDRMTERFRGIVDADTERQRVLDDAAREREALRIESERQRADTEAERRRAIELLARERAAAIAENERQKSALAQRLAGVTQQIQTGSRELSNLHDRIAELRADFAALDEESNLQSFGFYRPHYDFADSKQYAAELDRIQGAQKSMLKEKAAAVCGIEWTVNGSKSEGRKSTNQTLKLMLRAFNGECDAAIAKVRYNNVHVMEARITKAHEVINGLAEVQKCSITDRYRDLRLQELRLAHEYEEKLQEEKEEQRRIREQMREEEIAERELEKARLDAEREEQRYEKALAKAREDAERAVGAKQEKLLADIEELKRRLDEAHVNKERAISRAQMTRSGHVYVISNVGSFGEHVYKIGMTRRLDPLDRIKELGDASVPFQFDVHAVIFSEDAPALETKLHRAFTTRRVNRVNEKKEFFNVAIEEIAGVSSQHHGSEVTMTLAAEAAEYRKTLAMREEERVNPRIAIRGSAPAAAQLRG